MLQISDFSGVSFACLPLHSRLQSMYEFVIVSTWETESSVNSLGFNLDRHHRGTNVVSISLLCSEAATICQDSWTRLGKKAQLKMGECKKTGFWSERNCDFIVTFFPLKTWQSGHCFMPSPYLCHQTVSYTSIKRSAPHTKLKSTRCCCNSGITFFAERRVVVSDLGIGRYIVPKHWE